MLVGGSVWPLILKHIKAITYHDIQFPFGFDKQDLSLILPVDKVAYTASCVQLGVRTFC